MIEEIPPFNGRIKKIIELHSNGNVRQFADFIGVSQQKLNRLFSIDSRTKKWPVVPTDIIVKINEMFVNIDPDWLLTGKGGIYRVDNKDKVQQLFSGNVKTKNTNNVTLEKGNKKGNIFETKPNVQKKPSMQSNDLIPLTPVSEMESRNIQRLMGIIEEQAAALRQMSKVITGEADDRMNELRERRKKLENNGK